MPTEILIVGAGAIGAFYASRLAQAPDTHVSVICRSNYAAVQAGGFHISSPQYGDYTFAPTRTFGSPDEARGANIAWDFVVVSTKALPDVSDDSALLEGLVRADTAIVLVQNGLGVEHPYARRFPRAPVCTAVTVASCAQPEPARILHNRWTRISSGPWQPHLDTGPAREGDAAGAARNEHFVSLLRQGGIADAEAHPHATLQLVRWHKVAINAAMNPTSVLCGCAPNAAMAADPELAAHLRAVMDEVLAAAPRVLGAPFPPGFASPDHILSSTRKNTSGSRPSMALDWEQGRRLEIEVILGNPIRIARERGIEMPRLQSLYAMLRMAQETRDRETARSKM